LSLRSVSLSKAGAEAELIAAKCRSWTVSINLLQLRQRGDVCARHQMNLGEHDRDLPGLVVEIPHASVRPADPVQDAGLLLADVTPFR
jgi:hypothetical protein